MSRRRRRERWFGRLHPKVQRAVRMVAEALAADDPDLREDLMQEGVIAVWALEPDCLEGSTRRVPLALRAAMHAMISSYRQHLGHRYGIPAVEVAS